MGWIYPFGARRLMKRYHGFVGACPELVEGLLATTGYAKVSSRWGLLSDKTARHW